MGVATHTSQAMYNLARGTKNRGPKLVAALLEVDDGETFDTGLDTIEASCWLPVEPSAIANTTDNIWNKSISGGVITFIVNDIHDYTDGSALAAYGHVLGSVR